MCASDNVNNGVMVDIVVPALSIKEPLGWRSEIYLKQENFYIGEKLHLDLTRYTENAKKVIPPDEFQNLNLFTFQICYPFGLLMYTYIE